MRISLLLTLLLVSAIALAQSPKSSPFIKDLPKPARAVNDFGKFLTAPEKQYLEKELVGYHQNTGNAIVIITLDSLTDPKTKKEYTVEETALLYFNKWGIGDSIKNNGVLLLVSRKPRRVRIEVGKGLETILTNDICQQIIDDKLVPAFKAGLFFTGLKDAVMAIEGNLDQPPAPVQQAVEAPAQPHEPVSSDFHGYTSETSWGSYLIFFLILGGVMMIFFGAIVKIIRGESGLYSSRGYHGYRSNFYNQSYNSYSNNFFSSGSSSGFSSGGSSSSSSSSGSFGGGSSSGGGASGSW